MDFFKRVLGGPGGRNDKGAAKINAQQKTESALQDLKSKQRDCETKLTDLQRRIDDTTNEVKGLLQKGQREKAKLVLRRKNMLEKQVTSVQNNSDRLAEQILQMEMSQSNIQTVAALQQAAAAGKANLKANDIEDVDLVLDEIAEQNDQMVQITEALAQSTIAGVDDDDLEAELNDLEDMQIDETFATVPQTKVPTAAEPAGAEELDLPAAPTGAAGSSKTAEDLELEKLLAETGMTPAQ
eukprot:jgi/Ulvmu1/10063/UM006_0010.1